MVASHCIAAKQAKCQSAKAVIGFGDPVLDIVARVEYDLLHRLGAEAGGCHPVDKEVMLQLLSMPEVKQHVVRAPGGSAANVIKVLAGLGQEAVSTRFVGMLGNDDAAEEYRFKLAAAGVDCSLLQEYSGAATASCLCLVTPDGQRTMRTYLGAALELSSPAQLPLAALCAPAPALLHVEGYYLYRHEVAAAAMRAARGAGATVSLDLASFEVVRTCYTALCTLLEQRLVDMVIMNEDEAGALCAAAGLLPTPPDGALGSGESVQQPGRQRLQEGQREHGQSVLGDEQALAVVTMAQEHLLRQGGVRLVVTSRGAKGCVARTAGGEEAASPVGSGISVVDTVGAGDCFTAGFLYAWLAGAALPACCSSGCLAGSAAVQNVGAELSSEQLGRLRADIDALLQREAVSGDGAAQEGSA